jgi:hypothetical protein
MKFKSLVQTILVEASKKDVLINKLGVEESTADELVSLCGPLAVFMANKLIDAQMDIFKSWGGEKALKTKKDAVENLFRLVGHKKNEITSIMDWFRVGLNGDLSEYRNYTFNQLYEKSKQWHDELTAGGGKIDYIEEDEIIIDFRKDGIGFYWVNLDTNYSPEECDRMGHCGRTNNSNNIFSLRETKPLLNNHTLNKSHLTAAVGIEDKKLYQLKGPKNSKPKTEYHQFIIPFLLTEYVEGFGSEYQSANDFKISDLTLEEVKSLYQQKPVLFEGFSERRLLWQNKIIEKPAMNFTLTFDRNDLDKYVDGDYVIREYKNKETGQTKKYYMFDAILDGDTWELWDSHSYEGDWETGIKYHTNKNTENRLWAMVKEWAEKDGIELDEDYDLIQAIEEIDTQGQIQSAIRSALSDCEGDSYANYLYNQLKDAVSELGVVSNWGDNNISIDIDLEEMVIEHTTWETYEEALEICGGELSCTFYEMISNGDIEKPKFDPDERYTPDVDDDLFNEILIDRLNEI